MKDGFEWYVLKVRKLRGKICGLDLYEQVSVTSTEHFTVRVGPQSLAFRISLKTEGRVVVHRINLEEMRHLLIAWHEEKLVCGNMEQLWERAGELGVGSGVLEWIGGRV